MQRGLQEAGGLVSGFVAISRNLRSKVRLLRKITRKRGTETGVGAMRKAEGEGAMMIARITRALMKKVRTERVKRDGILSISSDTKFK